ncbi:MAG: glycosyl hydrolase family 17 protein [Anaerolineales bacterium]
MKTRKWISLLFFTGLILSLVLPAKAGNSSPAEPDPAIPLSQGRPLTTPLIRGFAYSPYRDCQDSTTLQQPTIEDIKQDLQIIRKMGNSIRTYSSTGISAQIPALAHQVGLRVSAGVWLGKDKAANELEIQGAINIAHTVPLDSIIVGNEVLLRGDLSEDELLGYIQRVKKAVKVPVTTAEIGSVLLQHPRVMAAVDYEMVHLYPFWDGKSINGAALEVVNEYKYIKSKSKGKRVVIGETGWPSGGPTNKLAIPSPSNQYRFAREFINLALKDKVDFYYFDAFDEMWKTDESGVGQFWGLFHSDRTPKYQIKSLMKSSASGLPALTDQGMFQATLFETAAPLTPFFVYSDWENPANHFTPSGWMGDITEFTQDTCVRDENPWPGTDIKVSYTPTANDTNGWAGVYWLQPDNNWGTVPGAGFNLTGYQQVIFQARSDLPGTQIKFFVGGVSTDANGNPLPYPSSIKQPIFAQEADPADGFVNLTTAWQDYHIDLSKADLSNVFDGFGWSAEGVRSPGNKVFYLDNIRFETTAPNPAPLPPLHIYSGKSLRPGLNMGVNTSDGLTDWVTDLDGSMQAAYPADQSWGAIFITVGTPMPLGERASMDISNYQTLSVEMKGAIGGETVSIGIKDKFQPDDGTETKQSVSLTPAWETYTFPISSFTGTDLTNNYIPIEFVFADTAETMYFRNVQVLP